MAAWERLDFAKNPCRSTRQSEPFDQSAVFLELVGDDRLAMLQVRERPRSTLKQRIVDLFFESRISLFQVVQRRSRHDPLRWASHRPNNQASGVERIDLRQGIQSAFRLFKYSGCVLGQNKRGRFSMNDVVDQVMSSYEKLPAVERLGREEMRAKIGNYLAKLSSAGHRDADELIDCGLAYIRVLRRGSGTRFTGSWGNDPGAPTHPESERPSGSLS